MNEKKEMSIAELAKEFEKSHDTIRRLLKHLPMHCISIGDKGKKLINADGVHILKSMIGHDSYVDAYSKNNLNRHDAQPEIENFKAELEFLKQQLNAKDEQISKLNDRLDNQLEKKDNQISELNQRLAESQELNRNQQVLFKQEQERLLLIENTQETGLLKRLFKKK